MSNKLRKLKFLHALATAVSVIGTIESLCFMWLTLFARGSLIDGLLPTVAYWLYYTTSYILIKNKQYPQEKQ